MTMIHAFHRMGIWNEQRGANMLDTGAPYYEVYETADGGHISFGSIEPQFVAEMLRITGLADDIDGRGPLPLQNDQSSWPAMKERVAALVKSKTRREWCELLEGSDACFAPVLSAEEAPGYPHNKQRGTFVDVAGVLQPAPAPRFSRTIAEIAGPPTAAGTETDRVLADWGFEDSKISELREAGAIR